MTEQTSGHGLWIRTSSELFENLEEGLHRSKALAALLGCPYPEAGYFIELIQDPEVIAKLKALSGPHGKTIMKIMKLRRGE